MNILMTTVSLDSRTGGGTAERTRRLVLHLTRQGHSCAVVTMQGGDLAEELAADGTTVLVINTISLRFQVPLIQPVALSRLVREADVIHLLGYWNLLSVATTFLAKMFGVSYVLSAAGEFAGLESPRPIARAFHYLFGRRMIKNAASLVAITSLEKQQILQRFGLRDECVIILPNGVEEQTLTSATRTSKSLLPDTPFILFVGRMAAVKGPDLLLQAFTCIAREQPSVSLVIAGPDFGMERELRAQVNAEGISDRVFFTGHLDEHGKRDAYDRALLLAVPSRAEAMSLVALEAGMAATPVLLTDQCGFNSVEEIGGGKVVAATADGLRQGLEEMLAKQAELPAMGRKLQKYLREEYAWPIIIHRLISHFEVIRGNRHGGYKRQVAAASSQQQVHVVSSSTSNDSASGDCK